MYIIKINAIILFKLLFLSYCFLSDINNRLLDLELFILFCGLSLFYLISPIPSANHIHFLCFRENAAAYHPIFFVRYTRHPSPMFYTSVYVKSEKKFFTFAGRKAFIGIGFADRGDSFDMIVAMQDHFK